MDICRRRVAKNRVPAIDRQPSSQRSPVPSATAAAMAASTTPSYGTNVARTPTPSNPTAPSPIATTIAQQTTDSLTVRPTETVDRLVGETGRRVHLRCVGRGDTTVMLIAGFGGDLTTWAVVEPALAEHARVCSYDRPGTGTSDPANGTTSFSTQATELHALLALVGEPGPYVLVGHSFGGAQAVMFASLFRDDVIGLVLVDASPTNWPATLCAVPDDGTDAAAMLRATCSGAFLPTGNDEHLDVTAAFAELSSITTLGPLPITVITATERELPADLASSERARLTELWNQGQQNWAALSTAAHLVSVDHTGHHIEIDQASVVIDAITRLLP
jgi:pimeloyl-ACP methyl ester carboxylesterase